jgi:hypothetical protein
MSGIIDFAKGIADNWETLAIAGTAALGSIVTLASTIVLITPSQRDDAFLQKVIEKLERWSVIKPKETK